MKKTTIIFWFIVTFAICLILGIACRKEKGNTGTIVKKEKLTGIAIFKIPEFRNIFVTDQFVERVKSTGLKGFWFPRRWSTDKTAIIDNVA